MSKDQHIPLRLPTHYFQPNYLQVETALDRELVPGSQTVAVVALPGSAQSGRAQSRTNSVSVVCRGRTLLAGLFESFVRAECFTRDVDQGIQLSPAEDVSLSGLSRSAITTGACHFQVYRCALCAAMDIDLIRSDCRQTHTGRIDRSTTRPE